ncbi:MULTISPECIES: tRNA glutamyl-Q(34) synthetase GluQRS [Rhodomicrobium]|uniref:tRNA glutamyl-Q(34) synthetase GluQRS n=1 Tax=Rhodomicrobium TaxID=1068 RepID=UPI000B4B73A9|nr:MULTISPECIES: tRNA glutamyl-Q(34) synthetase GluQRS [Rhodomicrobium]
MLSARSVFRFAPSPNGFLHLGHAFSALFTHAMAARHGGRFLLRIEDIDRERSRPDYEAAILDDLAWLGLDWERPVRRQSEHFDLYSEAIGKLTALGLIYPCFATRRDIAQAFEARGAAAPRDPEGVPVYPGLYRDLSHEESAARIAAGEAYALRLDMGKAAALAREIHGGPLTYRSFDARGAEAATRADPERWGDIVLARKDVPASYHIAVVTDDALQGVTHVTRGLDLIAATDIHRLLQVLLGLPEPLYWHHRLIVDNSGRKLSKSHRDKSLRSLRAEDVTPEAVKELVGFSGEKWLE